MVQPEYPGYVETEKFCIAVRKASFCKLRDQSAGVVVIQQLYSVLRGVKLITPSLSFNAIITHHKDNGYQCRKLSSKLHAVMVTMLGISDEDFKQPNSKVFEAIIATKLDHRLLGYALANYRFKQLLAAGNLDSTLYTYDWVPNFPDELKVRLKNSSKSRGVVVAIPVVSSIAELRVNRRPSDESLAWAVKHVSSLAS